MGVVCPDNHRIQLEYLSTPQGLALNLITMPCTCAIASSSALPTWPPQTSHPASTEDSLSDQNIASWPIQHYQIDCLPKFSCIRQTSSFIAYVLHATKLHSSNNHTPKPITPSPVPVLFSRDRVWVNVQFFGQSHVQVWYWVLPHQGTLCMLPVMHTGCLL